MRISRLTLRGLNFLYAGYAWCVLVVVIVPLILALTIVPGIMRRRRLARAAANLVCVLVLCPIRVSGTPIQQGAACIVVANHASYLDGIILTAALPARFAFLIKQEMADIPLTGFVLRRLGSEFVDRSSARDRHRMAKRLVETAQRGWNLAVFPEGTFDSSPGLKKFHSGAFTAAMRGQLPIVPVVINGAREKMPGASYMPRIGRVSVHFCEPVDPLAFQTADELAAATRRSILAVLKEPDLDAASTRLPVADTPN